MDAYKSCGDAAPRYRTVLFDLDGTLLWTVGDLADAVNHALRVYNHATFPDAAVERMVGRGVSDLVARALPGGFEDPDHPAVLAEFRRWYSAHVAVRTRPYPGIPALLERLRGAGVRLAVVTNKYQSGAEALMERFFPECVELVVGDAPEHARKPDPEGVALALRALGVGPEDAVYVGDTELDLETARRAGLSGICVAWGYRSAEELRAAGAPVIVRDAGELAAALGV